MRPRTAGAHTRVATPGNGYERAGAARLSWDRAARPRTRHRRASALEAQAQAPHRRRHARARARKKPGPRAHGMVAGGLVGVPGAGAAGPGHKLDLDGRVHVPGWQQQRVCVGGGRWLRRFVYAVQRRGRRPRPWGLAVVLHGRAQPHALRACRRACCGGLAADVRGRRACRGRRVRGSRRGPADLCLWRERFRVLPVPSHGFAARGRQLRGHMQRAQSAHRHGHGHGRGHGRGVSGVRLGCWSGTRARAHARTHTAIWICAGALPFPGQQAAAQLAGCGTAWTHPTGEDGLPEGFDRGNVVGVEAVAGMPRCLRHGAVFKRLQHPVDSR